MVSIIILLDELAKYSAVEGLPTSETLFSVVVGQMQFSFKMYAAF